MNIGTPVRWLIFLVVLLLGGFGLYSVYFISLSEHANEIEPNYCAMTYMWPSYLEIKLGNNSRLSHKFQLFLYQHELRENVKTQVRPRSLIAPTNEYGDFFE
jgi:hypothetical protein